MEQVVYIRVITLVSLATYSVLCSNVLNLTQDDVAQATGLSNNHISNIENNHSIPSIETLINICQALDITPDYFLLGIVRHTNDSLLSQINQKIKLCDEKKLELVDHFITWVVDEKL